MPVTLSPVATRLSLTAAPQPDESRNTAIDHRAPPMIEVHDLSKRDRSVHAVDGVGFSAAVGEIFGLLGHNGVGKTSIIQARPPTRADRK